MTVRIFRPTYVIEELGELGRLPDGAITNIGGVSGPYFTVGGQPLLFADGTSTGPGGSSIDLQTTYNASTTGDITLSGGKNFSITALNGNKVIVDAATGTLTVEGNLQVLGNSAIIEGTVQNVDQLNISMPNGTTTGLVIQPMVGATPAVNLVEIRTTTGGTPVFFVDPAGSTNVTNLFVSGLINNVDIVALSNSVASHLNADTAPAKHTASQISVAPLTNFPGDNVQSVLEAINLAVGTTATSAGLFFIDAAPTSGGIVANKLYVAGTVPANKVIFDATADTNNVTVTLFAEGDSSFYSPTVSITTVPPQVGGTIIASLVEDPNDKRAYTATALLTNIVGTTVVNALSSTGAAATMTIQRAAAGPAITALTIGALPGTQTEAKLGDAVPVTGIIENSATYAEVIAGGAVGGVSVLALGAADSAGPGFKALSGTFTVGSGTGPQGIQARGRNALGTFGSLFASSNTIVLNQTYPVIGARTITYPIGQLALKLSESATVAATVTNADVVNYTATNLSVALPSTYAVSKTVTRTGGTYSVGTNNYTITAIKTSNNASAIASSAVSIANVAPTCAITIVGNPTRLRSSPTGVNYTVTITANQQLLTAPSLNASSGTWQGVWAGSGTTWTRVLRITDTDPKGAQLFSSAALTGLAGLVGTTITSGANYVIGGFVSRTITFAPFERYHAIGTNVVDITKVTASYTGSTVLTFHPDTGDYFQGFTIVDATGLYDPTGGFLFISDAAFAGANTTGTLQLTIEEVA